MVTCPNPKCCKKIENLIIVSNTSTAPEERYYACPHCLAKLDVVSFDILKKQAKRRQEERSPKLPEKEKGYSRCGAYVGYLANLSQDEPIPRECLTCPRRHACIGL